MTQLLTVIKLTRYWEHYANPEPVSSSVHTIHRIFRPTHAPPAHRRLNRSAELSRDPRGWPFANAGAQVAI
jgi:hypothetical protein